jgi:hypothetical protein
MAGDGDLINLGAKALQLASKAGGAVVDAVRGAAQKAQKFADELSPKETLVCVLLFVLWVALFAIGATVPAKDLIKQLRASNFLFYLPAITIAYAYSNIAFLALLSGALGGFLSRLSLNSYADAIGTTVQGLLKDADIANSRSISYQVEPPIASAIRSFAVYLLYIAGIAIVVPGASGPTEALAVDGAQYIRIAGLISAVSFAVGYDPTIFSGLLARLNPGHPAPPPPNAR